MTGPEVCPGCGTTDVEVVAGHHRHGARAPRTVICYACQAIHEQTEGEWRQVVDR